jgi:hypothetical protein
MGWQSTWDGTSDSRRVGKPTLQPRWETKRLKGGLRRCSEEERFFKKRPAELMSEHALRAGVSFAGSVASKASAMRGVSDASSDGLLLKENSNGVCFHR